MMAPQVLSGTTDITEMIPAHDIFPEPDYQFFLQARATRLAVRAIRKAQGKANPGDFAVGSDEWLVAFEDFGRDLVRALAALGNPPA